MTRWITLGGDSEIEQRDSEIEQRDSEIEQREGEIKQCDRVRVTQSSVQRTVQSRVPLTTSCFGKI